MKPQALRSSLLAPWCLGAFSLLAVALRVRAAAAQEEERVVLVETLGAPAWPSVEKRVTAELVSIGKHLITIRAATEKDLSLPQYALRFKAGAVLQVLRTADAGVVRAWIGTPSNALGVYRHVMIDLRGPEVLSDAALAAVELIVNREQALKEQELQETPIDSSTYSGHLASGLLFAGGGVQVAFALSAALRRSVAPHLSVEFEPFFAPFQLGRDSDDVKLQAGGARVLLGYSPWLSLPVKLRVGIGGAYTIVPPRFVQPDRGFQAGSLCVRNQFDLPLTRGLDLTLVLTWSHAINAIILERNGVRREAFDGALDAMLGLNFGLL